MQISDYGSEPFITNMDKAARPSSPLKIYAVKTKQSPKGNCFILMVQMTGLEPVRIASQASET